MSKQFVIILIYIIRGKYARHGNVKYQFYMLPLQHSNLHHENIVTFIKDNSFKVYDIQAKDLKKSIPLGTMLSKTSKFFILLSQYCSSLCIVKWHITMGIT